MAPGVKTLVANNDISAESEAGEGYGNALLAFLVDLNDRNQDDLPKVLSLSLGSLSYSSCNNLCQAYDKQ